MSLAQLVTLIVILTTVYGDKNVLKLPNGALAKDPSSGLPCEFLFHEKCQPGKNPNDNLNAFGRDFRLSNFTYTLNFCRQDSDGDGISNGAELGDPCCLVVSGGKVNRSTDLSHPGLRSSIPKQTVSRRCPSGSPGAGTDGLNVNIPTPFENVTSGGNGSVVINNDTIVPATDEPLVEGTETVEESPSVIAQNQTDPEVVPETPSPNAPVCFPADAKVELSTGEMKTMEQLEVGDEISIGNGKYSTVFMFTHALRDVKYEFVQLTTEKGSIVTLTSGHFIYVNDELVRGGEVQKGDMLRMKDNTYSPVISVDKVSKRGLYNPQTTHGDVVVNGIVASTYTQFVSVDLAHAALSPLRAAFTSVGLYTTAFHGAIQSLLA